VLLAGGELRISNDLTLARPVLFEGDANTLHTGAFDLHLAVAAGGGGGVVKRGAGTLHLNGTQTHAGATVIAEGGLKFAGAMHGSLTLGAASTLHVNVDAGGHANRIDVTGADSSVTLDGGRLAVSASDGDYAARTSYTILTAPSVSGAFADVTTDLAFLTPAVGVDTDRVVLVLTRNQVQIADFADTPDQRGAGHAVGALLQRGGDDAAAIANAFNTLSVREVGSALEQVSGSTLTALGRAGGVHDRMLGRVTGARLAQLTRGGSAAGSGAAGQANLLLAMAGSDGGSVPVLHAMAAAVSRSSGIADRRHGVWLRGLAAGGRVDVSANGADAASLRSAGLLAGYDHAVTPALTLGAFAAHMSATVENGAPQSEDERSSWIAGVYGRYEPGALYLDAQASLGFDAFETSRRIDIGPLQRTAHADFDGDTRSVRLEVGHGIGSGYQVEPYAGLAWIGQQQDAFTETGAGGLNLSVARQQFDSVRSTLGVRTRFTSGGNGSSTDFVLYAAWAHEWASQGTLSSRLAGDAVGAPFQVRGAAASRNSAQVGLGLAHRLRDDLSLFVDVDGEFNKEQQTVGFSAGLKLRW
jgi:subtilase-type serine protease